jgi:hypothetical protein
MNAARCSFTQGLKEKYLDARLCGFPRIIKGRPAHVALRRHQYEAHDAVTLNRDDNLTR